jgi:hypothetical protein
LKIKTTYLIKGSYTFLIRSTSWHASNIQEKVHFPHSIYSLVNKNGPTIDKAAVCLSKARLAGQAIRCSAKHACPLLVILISARIACSIIHWCIDDAGNVTAHTACFMRKTNAYNRVNNKAMLRLF